MNEKEYLKKMHESLNSYDVNMKHLSIWFSQVVKMLKTIKDQARIIKNPRHFGDYLEDEVRRISKEIVPKSFHIEKGYGVNSFSAYSQEQDILFIDGSLGNALYKSETIGYYPIESILASIEVKSNLTISELRKSVLSCVNLKKLNYSDFNFKDKPDARLFYAIFAYTGTGDVERFNEKLNNIIKPIPEALRPNMVFILDKGLYFPTQDGEISTRIEGMQKVLEKFKPIKNSISEEIEANNLILLFSTIIDHLFQQSKSRHPANYCSYITRPSGWGNEVKKGTIIKKYINGFTYWSQNGEEFSHMDVFANDVKCPSCKKEFMYYKMPPLSIEFKEKIRENMKNNNVVEVTSNKVLTCDCGKKIELQGFYEREC